MARAMGITPSSEEWEDIWDRTLDLGPQTSDPIPTRRSSGFNDYCSTSCCRREGSAAYFLHRKSHGRWGRFEWGLGVRGQDGLATAGGAPALQVRQLASEREVSDARMI